MNEKLPRAADAGRHVREIIDRAREHHDRTGEWPPDPLLDEIEEIRREILAENGNDWRRVLQWHREQDELFDRQNPNTRFVEKQTISADASGR